MERDPRVWDNADVKSVESEVRHPAMEYDAFLSYSHAADGKLSPSIQSALHNFARKWFQIRAMRVFRDQTSLSANPALWPSIEKALSASEFFLLLASPQAAESPWVRREIEWWLSNRSADRLLIVLTDGTLEWDEQAGDFDWSRTTALPRLLSGRFQDEPLYIDLRWAKTAESLSLRHTAFRAAVLDIAATVRNVPKDQLDGEDVRQHRRTRMVAAAVGTAILCFGIIAAWQGYIAEQARRAEAAQRILADAAAEEARLQRDEAGRQRDLAVAREQEATEQRNLAELRRQEAERQSRISRSRELSVTAMAQLNANPELSMLLAIEAVSVMETLEAEETLRQSLIDNHLRAVWRASTARAVSAVFSPRGDFAASASWDGLARLWDVSTGSVAQTFRAASSIVNGVMFSPDERFLVVWDNLARVRAWDVKTGKLAADIANAVQPAISSDSQRLLTVSLRDAAVWRLDNGEKISQLTGHSGFVDDAAFSPDGRLVATASRDGTANIWDTASGRLVRSLPDHGAEARSARFSPTGDLIVTAAGSMVRLWHTGSGELFREIQTGTQVQLAELSQGILAIFGDNRTLLWSLLENSFIVDLPGRYALSMDGDLLASPQGVWETRTGRQLAAFRAPASLAANDAAFSPDGKSVVVAYDDGTLRVWSAPARADVHEVVVAASPHGLAGFEAVTFSGDGAYMAAAFNDGRVAVWDAQGRLAWDAHAHADGALGIAFSPDGRLLATTGKDHLGRVWDARSGRSVAVLSGHTSWVKGAMFSPDGRTLLTESHDGTARLWSPSDGQARLVLNQQDPSIFCSGFSPDSRLVVTCAEQTAHIWERASGSLLVSLRGHEGAVTEAGFSPDSRYLVSVAGGPTGDKTARIWEAPSGRPVSVIENIRSAAFGPDNRRVLIIGDRGVRIWDWRSELSLIDIPEAEEAFWSPNGKFIVSANGPGELQLRSAASGAVMLDLKNLPLAQAKPVISADSQRILVGGINPRASLVNGLAEWNLLRVYACEVCAPLNQLLEIARRRATRSISAAEREIFLNRSLASAETFSGLPAVDR